MSSFHQNKTPYSQYPSTIHNASLGDTWSSNLASSSAGSDCSDHTSRIILVFDAASVDIVFIGPIYGIKNYSISWKLPPRASNQRPFGLKNAAAVAHKPNRLHASFFTLTATIRLPLCWRFDLTSSPFAFCTHCHIGGALIHSNQQRYGNIFRRFTLYIAHKQSCLYNI